MLFYSARRIMGPSEQNSAKEEPGMISKCGQLEAKCDTKEDGEECSDIYLSA